MDWPDDLIRYAALFIAAALLVLLVAAAIAATLWLKWRRDDETLNDDTSQ